MDQLLQFLEFLQRFRAAAADHGEDAGHDLQFVRLPPVLGHAPLEIGIESLSFSEGVLRRKRPTSAVRAASSLPGFRGAGLHDDGLPL